MIYRKLILTLVDSNYFDNVINLVGSLYNYGWLNEYRLKIYTNKLTEFQTRFIEDICLDKNIEIIKYEKIQHTYSNPYSIKIHIWTIQDCEKMFWVDAGISISASLALINDDLNNFEILIANHHYNNTYSIPIEWGACNINREYQTGFIHFNMRSSKVKKLLFYIEKFLVNRLCEGWSIRDLSRNIGFSKSNQIWDCIFFRHDQSVFNFLIHENQVNIKSIYMAELCTPGIPQSSRGVVAHALRKSRYVPYIDSIELSKFNYHFYLYKLNKKLFNLFIKYKNSFYQCVTAIQDIKKLKDDTIIILGGDIVYNYSIYLFNIFKLYKYKILKASYKNNLNPYISSHGVNSLESYGIDKYNNNIVFNTNYLSVNDVIILEKFKNYTINFNNFEGGEESYFDIVINRWKIGIQSDLDHPNHVDDNLMSKYSPFKFRFIK